MLYHLGASHLSRKPDSISAGRSGFPVLVCMYPHLAGFALMSDERSEPNGGRDAA